MACTANKTPLLRTVVARGYSAQASAKTAQKHGEIQTTILPNKICVATVDNGTPVSRVALVFRAGSRFENYDNLGVNHVLRVAAGLTNKNSTTFGVTRNIQQIGGSIECISDRENISYECQVLRKHLDTGLKFLHDVSLFQTFKPWEVSDCTTRIKADLARVDQTTRAVDLLHRAAYRTGLGNSLFCAKHHVGKISPETLQHYINQNFTSNRTAVVGIGVDHQMLVGYAKNLHIESGAELNVPASKYYGSGELKVDKAGNLAHVAIASEGVGLSNIKETCAMEVLREALGGAPVAKRGNACGSLGRAVNKAINSQFGVQSLGSFFSETSLIGFVLTASADDIGKGIRAAMQTMKSGSVSNEDFTRAKTQLKANYLGLCESLAGQTMDIGFQASLIRQVYPISDVMTLIDSITASDVNAIAKKAASGKWSMGAVGNLKNVPHVSNL